MTQPTLAARVRSLLGEAAHSYQGRPGGHRLADAARWLDGPLRVAIAGRVKAGKSTLLNALVGTRVAPTDAGECTRVITWYSHGREPAATAVPRGRPPAPLAIADSGGQWVVDLGGLAADDVARIDVRLPSTWLSTMTLVDTPGMGSLTESAGRRTHEFLGDTGSVDAVLYLMRHLHSSDVDFLDAFHDTDAAETNPVNAIGVLSRADEVGGGDAQAMANARRVAAGYRADPRVRGLVHTVLPVAGLLAETAATLTTADFAALAELAADGAPACAPLLLSATRFVAPFNAVTVAPETRARLLAKLGIYGVRLSLDAIRSGTADATALAAVLREHSGLDELRGLLMNQFAGRRDVLKADGALRLIDAVTREDPIPAAPRLRQAVERLRVGAHELAEIRLLTELRVGSVPGPPEQLTAMERLLGGNGTAIPDRLGLRRDAPAADIQAVVAGLHSHWRRVAQNRLADPALSRAAQVLQRTCEGLAAASNGRAEQGRPPGQGMAQQNGAEARG
jgi:dynamin family protein